LAKYGVISKIGIKCLVSFPNAIHLINAMLRNQCHDYFLFQTVQGKIMAILAPPASDIFKLRPDQQ